MRIFDTPLDYVRREAPDIPVLCFRPHQLARDAGWFAKSFPGTAHYAVKANTAPHILNGLWDAGIRAFDVASETEVSAVFDALPEAALAFMHPVKNRRSIARAYSDFGCRAFVLDTHDEFSKILAETGEATDLTLVVRIAVSNEGAVKPLAGKFGIGAEGAPALLQATADKAARVGVSFHVGSQCLQPVAYARAIEQVAQLVKRSGISPDILDIGGGFPAPYPGMAPPDMPSYADAVEAAIKEMGFSATELWSEPGRVLVASSESLLARVELSKPGEVFLNDGGFGALFDAVHERWHFPTRVHRADGMLSADTASFRVHGPTCDPADMFAHRLDLPADLREGDYIEFGQAGAYGRAIASRFNGFGKYETIQVSDHFRT